MYMYLKLDNAKRGIPSQGGWGGGGGAKLTLTFEMRLTGRIRHVASQVCILSHNLHVKIESDLAKTVICIVSTRSYTQQQTECIAMT